MKRCLSLISMFAILSLTMVGIPRAAAPPLNLTPEGPQADVSILSTVYTRSGRVSTTAYTGRESGSSYGAITAAIICGSVAGGVFFVVASFLFFYLGKRRLVRLVRWGNPERREKKPQSPRKDTENENGDDMQRNIMMPAHRAFRPASRRKRFQKRTSQKSSRVRSYKPQSNIFEVLQQFQAARGEKPRRPWRSGDQKAPVRTSITPRAAINTTATDVLSSFGEREGLYMHTNGAQVQSRWSENTPSTSTPSSTGYILIRMPSEVHRQRPRRDQHSPSLSSSDVSNTSQELGHILTSVPEGRGLDDDSDPQWSLSSLGQELLLDTMHDPTPEVYEGTPSESLRDSRPGKEIIGEHHVSLGEGIMRDETGWENRIDRRESCVKWVSENNTEAARMDKV